MVPRGILLFLWFWMAATNGPSLGSSSCMVSIFSVISWSSNFSKEVFPDCCKLECWLLRQFWSMIFLLRARKSPKTCWFSAFELRDLTSSNDSSIARPLSITRFSWLICMKSRDRLGFLLDTSSSSELQSKSYDEWSHMFTSDSKCLAKGFWKTILANWRARHGKPICVHESNVLHPGHAVIWVMLEDGTKDEQELQ